MIADIYVTIVSRIQSLCIFAVLSLLLGYFTFHSQMFVALFSMNLCRIYNNWYQIKAMFRSTDACSLSPCGDNGRCNVTENDPGYVCTCIDGYSGVNCSISGKCKISCCCWLFLRINVDLAIFQSYLDLEAGDNQSLKIQVAKPGIEPWSSCSASQELNHSATAAPKCKIRVMISNIPVPINRRMPLSC